MYWCCFSVFLEMSQGLRFAFIPSNPSFTFPSLPSARDSRDAGSDLRRNARKTLSQAANSKGGAQESFARARAREREREREGACIRSTLSRGPFAIQASSTSAEINGTSSINGSR